MLAKILASVGLLCCLVLAVHMALPAVQRARLEAWLTGLRSTLRRGPPGRLDRRARRRAAHQEAQDAIARARRRAHHWDGNVYRATEFDRGSDSKH